MSDGKWEIKVTNIDATAIYKSALEGMVHGMNTWLEIVASQARQKAPIRRVFKDQMKSRRTSWRTVFMGQGSAESVMASYRLMYSGMTPNENRNVRVKMFRGNMAVQVRSWKTQGPAQPSRSQWAPGNKVILLGKSYEGLGRESELTSRARWAYMQGLREWREPGAGSYQTTGMQQTMASETDERTGIRPISRKVESHVVEHEEAQKDSILTVVGEGKTAAVQVGGTLRRSIHVARASVDGTTVSGKVIAGVRYAKYVEFGTATRGRAQPFLRPALHQSRNQLARSVASDVRHKVIQGGKA